MLAIWTHISAASGKLNGVVAARNRGGNYLREYVVPVDPETARQVNCREAMQALWTKWSTELTEAQRQSWARYAAEREIPGRLGVRRELPGWQAFCREKYLPYQANEQLGAAFAIGVEPPTYPQPFRTMPYAELNADNESMDVYWDEGQWPAVDDHAAIFVYRSNGIPITRNFFKGPYQLIGMISGDPDTPPTSPVNIPLGFELNVNHRSFYRLRFWGDDFILSEPFIGSIIRE